ncbi:MAG: SRPBCC family protein [Candidatus Limnocylindria bacterium]
MTAAIPPIDRIVAVPVRAATAWAAITDPDRIAEWFTDASPLGRPGDAYRLDFGDGSVVEGEVVAVEPRRSFAHTWHWAGAPDSETTTVRWSVEASGEGATIRLVHDGWAEAGLDRQARDDHDDYWVGYVEDLEAVLRGQR